MSEAPPRPHRFECLRLAIVEHNWFHVAVEVLIVAVGVLLAFEVEQWGDRRERAAEERQFLERLYLEYGRAKDEMRTLEATHVEVISEFRQVFAHRQDSAALERYSRTPNFGCPLPRFRDAPFNDTSFQELVSSGRINIISDPLLRNDVRNLAAAQAASARQVDAARDLVISLLPAHDRYIRFDMTSSIRPNCEVDWSAMINDRGAMATVVRAYFLHSSALTGRRRVREQIDRVRATIGCKLGKPECRQATLRPS